MIEHEAEPGGEIPTPIERVSRPFQVFARFKASGAIVLMVATAAALVLANTGAVESYRSILRAELSIGYGDLELTKPLLLWINDALMGVFFFLVGLEIKREVLAGELTRLRNAMLPIAGAVGGMIVPAVLFVIINPTTPNARGWAAPMATDIAFALGVLALLGSRVPLGLKVFLTALAIVDDLGAIVVIALFYTETLSLPVLAIGGLLLGISLFLNFMGLRSAVVFFAIGALVWLAFLKSGVHATLASVLMALTIPARTRIEGGPFLRRMANLVGDLRATGIPKGRGLLTTNQQNILQHMGHTVEEMTAPLQQLEHALVPFVAFLVVPVFALANAGVVIGGDSSASLLHPVAIGIGAGLLIGKQVGILGFSWLAVRAGVAHLPSGVTWRQIHAVSVLGGIGFTMSLFIAGLAYRNPTLISTAKLGILVASMIATVAGLILLWRATPARPSGRGPGGDALSLPKT